MHRVHNEQTDLAEICLHEELHAFTLRAGRQDRAILVDGTHGTNKYKFCLTTVMVIDSNKNKAIPVAFFIHSRSTEEVLREFFDSLARSLGDDFCPSIAIVDDAIAEINALQGSLWRD